MATPESILTTHFQTGRITPTISDRLGLDKYRNMGFYDTIQAIEKDVMMGAMDIRPYIDSFKQQDMDRAYTRVMGHPPVVPINYDQIRAINGTVQDMNNHIRLAQRHGRPMRFKPLSMDPQKNDFDEGDVPVIDLENTDIEDLNLPLIKQFDTGDSSFHGYDDNDHRIKVYDISDLFKPEGRVEREPVVDPNTGEELLQSPPVIGLNPFSVRNPYRDGGTYPTPQMGMNFAQQIRTNTIADELLRNLRL